MLNLFLERALIIEPEIRRLSSAPSESYVLLLLVNVGQWRLLVTAAKVDNLGCRFPIGERSAAHLFA